MAYRASCSLSETPVFLYILLKCDLTACSLIFRAFLISLFDKPLQTNLATSISLSVREVSLPQLFPFIPGIISSNCLLSNHSSPARTHSIAFFNWGVSVSGDRIPARPREMKLIRHSFSILGRHPVPRRRIRTLWLLEMSSKIIPASVLKSVIRRSFSSFMISLGFVLTVWYYQNQDCTLPVIAF